MTQGCGRWRQRWWDFNPHHYESGDELRGGKPNLIHNFNPHHYESGDVGETFLVEWDKDFNPHHYESGDLILLGKILYSIKFQSTPLREWWRNCSQCLHYRWDFNPHHYESGDHQRQFWRMCFLLISIHTTTRVVTQRLISLCLRSRFQSTPLREWWPLKCLFSQPLQDNFNPHHYESGD